MQDMKKQSEDVVAYKKHICLDARMYQHSGIGVYLLQLIHKIRSDKSVKLTLLVPELDIPEFKDIPQIELNAPIYSIKEQLLYPLRIPACDIFWSPHYNMPILPVRAKKRWVTIHDIYHLRFAHSLGWHERIYAKIFLSVACRRSEKIFTVSNFSRKELLHFFSVNEKIQVVPNKVDIEKFSRQYPSPFSETVLKKYQINFPYILFVGNVKPNKNLITLIKAFEKIQSRVDPVKLLIVGKKEGFIKNDNEVGQYLESHNEWMESIFFTGSVSHDELPIIYQKASLFVFPSIYEGFGYPPLEALAAGIPVLCSNADPMPEVCGDKVFYFPPKDIEQLSDLILKHLIIQNVIS